MMNKLKIIFLFILLPVLAGNLYAQDKMLTMRDAVVGQVSYLYPQYLSMIHWKDTKSFTHVKSDALVAESLKGGSAKEVITLEEINEILKAAGKDALKYIPQYSWKDEVILCMKNENTFIEINTKTKKLEFSNSFDSRGENSDKHKTGRVAYTVENNLYISDEREQIFAVSEEKNRGIVYGQEVHRREFGINKGTFWSPDGSKLAFYRKDETMVSDYPIVNIETRVASLENIKYPMAGMASQNVTLGVYSLENEEIVYMKTGEPKDQYLTSVTWSPDGKSIYIALLNREQNHMKLNCYNASTGELEKTLFEEKNDRYVEPQTPLMFLKTDPEKFIWQSRRDGYNHLYLYDTNGKLVSQITKGDWLVTDIIGFDPKEEYLFIESTEKSPIERHVYKINMKDYSKSEVTKEEGVHKVHLSPDGKYLTDGYSNIKTPKVINLIDANGKKIRNILTSDNPLKNYKMPEAELITIKSADGKTDLHGRLIKPIDFDKSKKYPAIVYVYGGPHAQLVMNSWLGASRLWQYLMAQKGYVMLTIDNRGSANRGFEFESVIHRNVGELEMADQMKGIEYLQELGYVDMERIGVHGWSYGGFMTTSLILNHPDVFKVAVAGGPVIDWSLYEVMYGERYMDTPQENPEGYKKNNLALQANKLEGKLMLIHGAIDPVVVWQNSMKFIRACVENNKQVDYFVYPRHEHNVSGMDRIHLMDKVTNYFEDYLK